MHRPWHTSASIVLAGAFVAIAIYLGLRERAAPTDAGTASAQPMANARGVKTGTPILERDRRGHDEPGPSERPDARGSSAASASTPPIDRQRSSEADRATAVAPPLGGMPPVAPALVERVQRDARDAFDGIRDQVRSRCWDALPDDPDAPEAVEVVLSLSFDPHGAVLASGITDDREQHRPGLAACLGPLVHGLSVPAPKSHLSVEVRVEVP